MTDINFFDTKFSAKSRFQGVSCAPFLKLNGCERLLSLADKPRFDKLQEGGGPDGLEICGVNLASPIYHVWKFDEEIKPKAFDKPINYTPLSHGDLYFESISRGTIRRTLETAQYTNIAFSINNSSSISNGSLFHGRDYRTFRFGCQEGSTTTKVSPNNNPSHERPAPQSVGDDIVCSCG